MKNYKHLLVFLSLLLLTGCNPYKRISLSGSDFYGRNKVIKNIDRYDIYVHQADSVYELVDPEATDSNRITGQVQALSEEEVVKKAIIDTTSKLKPGEQNDIHIYLDNAEEITDVKVSDQITLEAKNVESVNLTAKESRGALGVIGMVLLGILLVIVLLIGIIIAAVAASGSDGSGSDSGSNGSDSDSGCYIATMAYGSYEAPKVMTLRRFRDQFLQKYRWGRSFIKWYYKNSPHFVAKHASKKWLHVSIRKCLDVFVFIIKPIFK